MLLDRVVCALLTVSITVAATIIIAKMVGGTLPLAAKKLKLDPAIMAGPLITTIVDALALLFIVATAFCFGCAWLYPRPMTLVTPLHDHIYYLY